MFLSTGSFNLLQLLRLLIATGLFMAVIAAQSDEMQRINKLLIDRTEVTIEAFERYVDATGIVTAAEGNGGGLVYDGGWKREQGWNWRTPFGQPANKRLPAVHVTFDEAATYCAWAGKRLPTDAEWQTVAYTESRVQSQPPYKTGETYQYPIGDSPVGANCLKDCGPTTAIDFSAVLSRGIGPAPVATNSIGVNGLYDMGANVWEWTQIEDDVNKGTCGGSWWYGSMQMARGHRATKPRDMAVVYIGFRCVREVD